MGFGGLGAAEGALTWWGSSRIELARSLGRQELRGNASEKGLARCLLMGGRDEALSLLIATPTNREEHLMTATRHCHPVVKPRSAWAWLLQAVLVLSVAAPLAGCGDKPAPMEVGGGNEQDGEQVADVRIAIVAPEEATGRGSHTPGAMKFLGDVRAFASFADVAKIQVDISNVSANPRRVLYRNTELVRGNDGIWSATLPFLPRNVSLEFSAKALNAGGTELFNGVTQQTLATPNTRVTIALTPYDNNTTVPIPRITRISTPTELSSGASGSVTVAVEGSAGETIRFTAATASNGGELFPPSGSLTLAGTSGTIVFQYTAPMLSTEQTFEQTIAIENPRGTRVQSNFSTRVLPVGQTPSVSGTELRVQFSPIINNLIARRVPNTSNIEWRVEAADDRPLDQELLTYSWEFLPAETTYNPMPAFTTATRSTVMTNYNVAYSGTIRVRVTDADNGTTTLNWTLPVNQFLAQSELIVDVGNVGNVSGVASLEAGGSHSCVRLTTGGIRCWGRGNEGQLGYGNTTSYGTTPTTLPYMAGSIPDLDRALQIGTGAQHTCAVFDNGQVACWGRGTEGQLGYNSTQSVGDNEAVASYGYVNVGGNVSRITVGGNHTCVLLDTGNVRCWGLNNRGQLGYGTTATRPRIGDDEAPYTVGDVNLGGALVADVVAGDSHTCVLLRNGGVRCWGRGSEGQLGYGRNDDIGDNEPPLATNLDFNGAPVRQLAAGENHTCALLTNGAVRCWGLNSTGQLGIPALYSGSANYNNWGDNSTETPYTLQTNHGDVNLGAGRVALQLSAGAGHTCAMLDTGAVRCWGNNASGQLGVGDINLRSSPGASVDVRLGASVVRLASGSSHNCALLTTGRVRCWGLGSSGQLGYGNTQSVGGTGQVDGAGPVAILAP
jgi:alpha-tubulin suppressor-like RCC1 family protein